MNRPLIVLLLLVLPLAIVGCGGGGIGGSPDRGFDPTAYAFKAFTPANTPSLTNGDVRAVLQYENGTIRRLYIGTANGLFSADATQATYAFTRLEAAGFPTTAAAQAINALLQTRAGAIWIGTDAGLFSLDPVTGTVTAVTRLTGEKVTAFAEPKAGTFWVGLASDTASTTAIARTTNGTDFEFYGKEQGMTASMVVMIHATEDPFLVVACGLGTPGKAGLFKFNAAQNTFSVLDAPFLNGATLFKKQGDVYYAGGPGTGLRSQATRDAEWKVVIADITPRWLDIVPYGAGLRAWLAADDGLRLTFDLASFKLFTKANGLASTACAVVTQGAFGTFVGHGGPDGGFSRADLVGE
ncbi:MAG: hypothetical protein OZSIB_0135 [Candidatus Ozemobacter sibiricus]|uniref:Uncharacterized protein n=1 Tax=Candidatus Ozemobacter sibiricus TaxID=2268124 RepID=A0A367ZMA6_9BACT|nr:MAG: hypothetical protein OZSIB_0135 [Candidatus Ozemobacter sibiricus]